ncbi:ATP-dependent DNA helicase, partial [Trichonephila inaurata madagascariensis]
MSEDILHQIRVSSRNHDIEMNEEIHNRALLLIEDMCYLMCGSLLIRLGMPAPNREMNDAFSRELEREREYDHQELDLVVLPLLNSQQKEVYNTLMKVIDDENGGLYFLDAPGGTAEDPDIGWQGRGLNSIVISILNVTENFEEYWLLYADISVRIGSRTFSTKKRKDVSCWVRMETIENFKVKGRIRLKEYIIKGQTCYQEEIAKNKELRSLQTTSISRPQGMHEELMNDGRGRYQRRNETHLNDTDGRLHRRNEANFNDPNSRLQRRNETHLNEPGS